MNRIYLDYAAATPVDQRVRDVMQPFFTEVFYNPSGLYQGAREARTGLENARARVAKTLGTRPSEIIFTAGATESVNLAIKGVAQQFPEHEILISSVEHDCVRKAAESSKHQEVPVDEAALTDTLRAGRIAGAALDVFETEPLTASPLFDLDNVVLTPHMAGLTRRAKSDAAALAVENALAVLDGRPALNRPTGNRKVEDA